MKVQSWNEWGQLKSVIVGRADGARVPVKDKSLMAINYADKLGTDFTPLSGPYPQQVIDEANQDLEGLCETLTRLGVTVYRPEVIDTSKVYRGDGWESDGYYTYCPRDSVLVHGNNIIEAPMPLRARRDETRCFTKVFSEAMRAGAKWVETPRPRLSDDCYFDTPVDKNTLTLREVEPCFDAANILRVGRDLFYLVSNSGNKLGAEWLQSYFGNEFRVHQIENMYSYMHLDSTISFLKPGLVLLNPSRVTEDNLPAPLRSWDKIWCADPVDIGYYEGYCHSSLWIGMNLLMVSPDTAIVEENQKPLIKQLEERSIKVIPLPMRHSRTLGGGFHCVTLDLEREGGLEDYF